MYTTKIVFRKTPIKNNPLILGLGSWAIRHITGSWGDHAERLIGDYVYSGTQKGVRKMLFEDWKKLYNQEYKVEECEVPFCDEQFLKIFEQAEGTKYDYASLFWHLIYNLTGHWLWRKSSSSNAFYCTEFIAYASGLDQWWAWDVLRWENYCKQNKPK